STRSAPTARAAATTELSCRGSVGTFAVRSAPPSSRTASVKVPPTSTPRIAMAGSSYERTLTTAYPLELGLAVRVPWKKERRRQCPDAGGLHENRATPSEPV